MFLHPFFKGFSKIYFLDLSLVIKKLWAILDFFYKLQTFYYPVPYHMHKKKKNYKKNTLNYYL